MSTATCSTRNSTRWLRDSTRWLRDSTRWLRDSMPRRTAPRTRGLHDSARLSTGARRTRRYRLTRANALFEPSLRDTRARARVLDRRAVEEVAIDTRVGGDR